MPGDIKETEIALAAISPIDLFRQRKNMTGLWKVNSIRHTAVEDEYEL